MTDHDGGTTQMFTLEQIAKMLPEGASSNAHAVGTRCKKAGAVHIYGWPVAEIEQIANQGWAERIVVGTEPIEVYSYEQVLERIAHYGWHTSKASIYGQLNGRGARSHRGYTPPERVLAAMRRPAGSDWRRRVTGGLAGKTFIEPQDE